MDPNSTILVLDCLQKSLFLQYTLAVAFCLFLGLFIVFFVFWSTRKGHIIKSIIILFVLSGGVFASSGGDTPPPPTPTTSPTPFAQPSFDWFGDESEEKLSDMNLGFDPPKTFAPFGDLQDITENYNFDFNAGWGNFSVAHVVFGFTSDDLVPSVESPLRVIFDALNLFVKFYITLHFLIKMFNAVRAI